jgi:cytochrome c peroxidase
MNAKHVLACALVLLLAAGATAVRELTPKERLGKLLFEDTNLSTPRGQDCGACHGTEVGWTGPDQGLNAHGAVYEGAMAGRFGNRKPLASAYASFSPDFHFDDARGEFIGGNFWDGRAANIVEQAKGPFLNPLEQNNPDARAVCLLVDPLRYGALFEEVFGPGSLNCIETVPRTYDYIAEAIAAYEASGEMNQFSSKYDCYLAGRVQLTDQERRGLELFNGKANCARCHPSQPGPYSERPLFTNFTYENVGVPRNPENPFYGMPKVFNPDGRDYVDVGLADTLKKADYPPDVVRAHRGKMKVPTLRNVGKRPYPGFVKAYMHNGVFKSLTEVIQFYNTRDVSGRWPAPEVPENVNKKDIGNLGLTDQEVEDIVAFLNTLSDGYPLPKG